jgi:anti-anti-sigma factor
LRPGELLRVDKDTDGVLRVAGDIDLATAKILRTHLDSAAQDGPVVVDLTEVLLIQSAGVAVLYDAAPNGLRLRVRAGSAVATVMRITGLDRVATVEHLDPDLDGSSPQ